MRRPVDIAVILFASLIAASAVAAAIPHGDPFAVAKQGEGLDTFLGFDVGEERRYAIAPEDSMRPGEAATWSTRLVRVEHEGDRAIGVFELTHEQRRAGLAPQGTLFVHWHFTAEARINQYGFPEAVDFSLWEEHTGEAPWRGEIMSASYTFNGEGYDKTVRVPEQTWEFDFPIATHDALDLDLPAGMFLFRPQAAGIDFFANPALLGFVLPELIPDSWEQRVLFFRPTYPVRHPGEDYVRQERDKLESLRRYYVKQTLKMGAPAELEIGDRVLNVRRLEITGPLRDVYVDEFGRIVRIDIDPDPITRRDRHIRMLFPSEY